MENINTNMLIAAIVGFVIGFLVVWVINLSRGGKNSKEYGALKKEYDAYRDRVNKHFAQTADAIDNLTKSYKDVFTHLSEGAQTLMDKSALQAQIEKRKDKTVTLSYLANEKDIQPQSVAEKTKELIEETKHTIKKQAERVTDKAENTAEKAKDNVEKTAEKAKETVVKTVEKAEDKVEEVANSTAKKTQLAKDEHETAIDNIKKHINKNDKS